MHYYVLLAECTKVLSKVEGDCAVDSVSILLHVQSSI